MRWRMRELASERTSGALCAVAAAANFGVECSRTSEGEQEEKAEEQRGAGFRKISELGFFF